MRFEYELVGTGWAKAIVANESSEATVTASYLSDALGDLLYMVWRSLESEPEVRCSWEEEPGEYRWIMRRAGDDARLRVLDFDGGHPRRPDESGRLVFETSEPVLAIARAIALGASRCLAENGARRYADIWRTEFPFKTLRLVQSRR
jgi:hypothetical protein